MSDVAEAGRGFILWSHGEHIADCGALFEEVRDRLVALDPEVAKFRIGYLYSSVGVFWLDFGRGVAGMYSSSATPFTNWRGISSRPLPTHGAMGACVFRLAIGYRPGWW